jgi:uncharacterized protein YutD
VSSLEKTIKVLGVQYELIRNERNGWNPDAFRDRYSDILTKYEYIVGDWGYGQLRLKGFFDEQNKKVPSEQKIGSLDEYIQEYCNFGCAYFVVKKSRQTLVRDVQPLDEE